MQPQIIKDNKHKRIFKCEYFTTGIVRLYCFDASYYLPKMCYTLEFFDKLIFEQKLVIIK